MQDRTNTVRCIRLNPFQKSMGKRNSDKSFFPVTMFAEDSLEPSSNLSELLWGTVWESGLLRENKWANVYVSTCQLNASLFSEVTLRATAIIVGSSYWSKIHDLYCKLNSPANRSLINLWSSSYAPLMKSNKKLQNCYGKVVSTQ